MTSLQVIVFRAMGCEVSVQLQSSAGGLPRLCQLPAAVEAIEACLSRFRPDSELMRLNQRAGEWVIVSETLFDNVHAAKHAARLTEGLFNPLILPAMLANGYDRSFEQLAVPQSAESTPAADWRSIELRTASREIRFPAGSALDLGGIAKGWTASKLADELVTSGPCLVNIGGDMAVRGAPDGLPGWPVEISDPCSQALNDTPLVTLHLSSGAVVTSGVDFRHWKSQDGQTYHHIVDPRTGRSVETDVLTATVIHPHAPTAEAYAKAMLLRGAEAGLRWLNQQWYAAGLVVQKDGKVLTTSNFAQFSAERITS